MVCLETSFLVDLFRGEERAVQRMQQLERSSEAITVAAPTVMEIATGAELNEAPRERGLLREFLDSVTTLPLDKEAALLAGSVNAQLIKAGEMIGEMDILIGVVAAAHGERLLARNLRHFSRIPGLETEGY